MIIRRQTLEAVMPAVMAKDVTHRLDRIEIRPDGHVTATDGHILLAAKEHTRFPDEDFPQVAGTHYTGDAATPLLLPIGDAKQLLKTAPKKSTIPILGAIQIGMNGSGAFAATTDLQASTSVKVHGPETAIGGPFPNWSQGIIPPKDQPAILICLGAPVLRALAEAAEKAETSTTNTSGIVYLYLPTEKQHQGDRDSDHEFDGNPEDGKGCSCGEDHAGWSPNRKTWDKIAGGNGQITGKVRVEIKGREVAIEGAIMPCVMP